MRCCIFRGAHEIGGSCVVLEHDGVRLMLDLGRPLDAGLDVKPPEPIYPGLDWDLGIAGLLISHGHPDHYGWASHLPRSVAVYIGEAAERILREALFFSPAGAELNVAGRLRDREPFVIGPFDVTPYLADHSAFDAYSLLIEAGGRRVFYTGDLRAHGRKRSFARLLADPPRDVDVLMLEGTHVRSSGELNGELLSEQQLEQRLVETFEATDGMALAAYSAQNIDRMVTLYRAAKRTGRVLVLDLYGATIARATGRLDAIPQASWDGVRVFVPLSQRIRVKRERAFERIDWLRPYRLYPDQLAGERSRLVMTFRASMTGDLDHADCLDGAVCAWSLWPGYLDQPGSDRLISWLSANDIPLKLLHASGHASVPDLQRLATAICADRVVPIHTSAPERFPDLFDRVEPHADEDWWEV